MTRGKRHQFVMVKRNQITNLRVQKVFKPSILFFLTDMEFNECCWGSSEAERLHAENFVRCWNEANEKAEG